MQSASCGGHASFDEALASARRYVEAADESDPAAPGWIKDQLGAASRDLATLTRDLADHLQALGPERGWRSHHGGAASVDSRARLLVAARSITAVCSHLRTGGPQPAIARLALRRVDCTRCAVTHRTPPADEADTCDWCCRSGVERFTSVAFTGGGPVLFVGDACDACADALIEDVAA